MMTRKIARERTKAHDQQLTGPALLPVTALESPQPSTSVRWKSSRANARQQRVMAGS
jgi:hypothetical protein